MIRKNLMGWGMVWVITLVWAGALAGQELVKHSDVWKYRKGTNVPQGDWKVVADAGLDGSWLEGVGGFGYADNAAETQDCGTLLADMEGQYRSIFLRREFHVGEEWDAKLRLKFSMDFDDGFLAWLDGVPLTNRFVTGAPAEPLVSATANASHEASRGNSSPQPVEVYDLGEVGSRLGVGRHVLAVMALNNAVGSSDFVVVPDLYLEEGVQVVTNCWSGTIVGEVVWDLGMSPVRVCGALTVGSGGRLRIEPGVRVELDAGVGVVVADGGVLWAEGTEQLPIVWTRYGNSGRWKNLVVRGSVGSPESRISHARFEFNVDSTGTPCIDVDAGTVTLEHLVFLNTVSPYVHVDGASFVISHCTFPSATANFELLHGTGGVKAGGRGVFYRNYFGRARGYNDVIDFTGGNRPSQPVVHFIENVLMGGDDDGFDLDGTDAWVEGNIFMRFHRNAGTPDSASAVSGGNDGARTSEVTVVRNLFLDCDTAATAKQGNYYVLLNNTVWRQTKEGGIDTGSGVLNVRDVPPSGNPTTFGKGFYVENNIVWEAEALVRNWDGAQTSVVMVDNLLPVAWVGGGEGNVVGDPGFKKVPALSELDFANWEAAQVLWDWFSLQPGSPALGRSKSGGDWGAVIPAGVTLVGVPKGSTTERSAKIEVGWNRSGSGIPELGWPEGAGYVGYRYRLDGGEWSEVRPLSQPLELKDLGVGEHVVEVSGRRDTGLDQDDLVLGGRAVPTRSGVWTVESGALLIEGIVMENGSRVRLRFQAEANVGYTIYRRERVNEGEWKVVGQVEPAAESRLVEWPDDRNAEGAVFYRVSSP